MLRLDMEWVVLLLVKMKRFTLRWPVAWRTWRPFTRIGRAKRVGRHALQATVPLTEDSNDSVQQRYAL